MDINNKTNKGDAGRQNRMSNEKSQREYWASNLDPGNLGREDIAQTFRLNQELAFYFSPEQEYALKKLWREEGPRRKRILEIGCGLGVFALFLAKQEAEVYVVDPAIPRLKFLEDQAQKLDVHERITIISAKAESLPFPDNFFDLIYTKSVLIHTDLARASVEMNRVLKPGGAGVFVEPLKGSPFAGFYRKYLAPKEWKNITTYFDRKRLGILSWAFGSVKVRYFYLFSFLAFIFQFGWRNLRLFQFFLKILYPVDEFLFTVCPFMKRFSWFAVITARKSNVVDQG
jgi:ubiquinone/menaquinone biosynthesis C-methylase UbiE